MKRTVVIALVCSLVLVFAASAVLAAPGYFRGAGFAGYTDPQKQELAPLQQKMEELRAQMFEVRKQMIQKDVAFGYATQEQADQRVQWMEERRKLRAERQSQGFGPGGCPGYGRGPGFQNGPGAGPGPEGRPGYGRGPCGGQGWRGGPGPGPR